MSYILEALKKSDQQRQQGAAPTLTSVQLPLEESREQKFPWLVALAAIVFIAGILIGWLQPWTSGQSVPRASSPAEKAIVRAPEVIPPATAPAPVSVPVETAPAPARSQEQVQPQKPAPAAPLPAASSPVPVQAPQVAVKPVPAAVARIDPPPAAVKAPPVPIREPAPAAPAKPAGAAEQNVMAKMELPPAILQELPAMTVSLHAYSSKPSNRLVSINDKLLQEGDSLAPGLILEEITRKDMIFTYKGYRFRQGVQ